MIQERTPGGELGGKTPARRYGPLEAEQILVIKKTVFSSNFDNKDKIVHLHTIILYCITELLLYL